MTWLAQVRHIAWKDVRQSRWMLGVYALIAFAATIRSIAIPSSTISIPVPIMFLVIVSGIATTATIVQADSPTRSDALWASRPFHSSAMFCAKLLLIAAVVLALPVVGEIAALRAFQVPSSDAAFLAWQSTVTYAMWLLATVVVAALTPDLRTFVVTFLAVVVGVFVVAGIPMGGQSSLPTAMLRELLAFVAVALGTTFLMRLYRTHASGRAAWTAAVLVVTVALTAIVIGAPIRTFPQVAMNPRPFPRIQVLDRNRIVERGRLQLAIETDNLPDTLAVEFATDSAVLYLRDGRTMRIPHETGPYTLSMPQLPTRPTVRWLGEPVWSRQNRLDIPLTDSDSYSIERDLTGVELVGNVSVLQPRVVGRLPLRTGASMTQDGTRARIARIDSSPDSTVVELETASATRQRLPFTPFRSSEGLFAVPRYALANFGRREAVQLYSGSSSAGVDWLVLPGGSLQTGTARLSAKKANGLIVPDAPWLHDADVLIVDWVPISNYPVRTKVAVP